jgi:hypothetical protein
MWATNQSILEPYPSANHNDMIRAVIAIAVIAPANDGPHRTHGPASSYDRTESSKLCMENSFTCVSPFFRLPRVRSLLVPNHARA